MFTMASVPYQAKQIQELPLLLAVQDEDKMPV